MLRTTARSLPTFGARKADDGDGSKQSRSPGLGQILAFCVVLPLCTVFWQTALSGALTAPTCARSSSSVKLRVVPSSQTGSASARPTSRDIPSVPEAPEPLSAAASGEGVDASWGIIQYSLQLWDIFLTTHVPEYQPGQHGITQPKYAGLKTRLFYDEMVNARKNGLQVKTICEVGMYAGASSQFFLLANKDAHLYTFDTFSKGKMLSKLAADTMVQMGRATAVSGSSLETVPEFPKKYPGVQCDIVFIDGSKKYDIRLQDLANFRAVSHKDTLVLLDEVCSNECVRNGPESACSEEGTRKNFATACMAYRTTVQKGEMEIEKCMDMEMLPEDFPKNDYVCSARFLYD